MELPPIVSERGVAAAHEALLAKEKEPTRPATRSPPSAAASR